ncbi:anti-sigma factor family protein [Saccharothrix sp. Mg75]|uniref:anti-sigma factor family protein n=1 Tax=Saccharothrix sp. Mg75 TaxID=3445357 RepID=UPI003EF043ED
MTELRGWQLPEQHLLPDAVVAFVDGELTASAHGRASAHLQRCPFCAAEAYSQQQARSAVRAAETPCAPAGLLARLGAIPQEVELPSAPDGLAVTEDGQLVTVQRPDRAAFGGGPVLGQSRPFGTGGGSRLGGGWFGGRRARQGAGVVVSGLMLGALALVAPGGEDSAPTPAQGGTPEPTPAVAPAVAPSLTGAGETDLMRPVAVTTLPGR